MAQYEQWEGFKGRLWKDDVLSLIHIWYGSVDMGAMMAMLVLAILPIIVFYLLSQKHIIKGVAAGAVKG